MRIEKTVIEITRIDDGILETIDIKERTETLEIIPLLLPGPADAVFGDPEALNEMLSCIGGLAWPAGDKLDALLKTPNREQVLGRAKRVEPLKLHNPNTLVKFVRHPDNGKALGCVVGVQDWDGSTKVGWSQVNPVDMVDEKGHPVKFDKHEAISRAIDRAFAAVPDGKKPATVKVDNSEGGPARVDLFLNEILTMKRRTERYFWKPIPEVLAGCYDCEID